jgi:hydroxymethylpyrimidine pyrophosphatase-like HAD family hydrolase
MIIAIDFDDTIVEDSNWPEVGKFRYKAKEVIKELKKRHTLILWTCRYGEYLEMAIRFLKENGIEFDYINECPLVPTSNKIYADVYIDDRALGGTVDWERIAKLFNLKDI